MLEEYQRWIRNNDFYHPYSKRTLNEYERYILRII